jgi:hypothetical protein
MVMSLFVVVATLVSVDGDEDKSTNASPAPSGLCGHRRTCFHELSHVWEVADDVESHNNESTVNNYF